MKVQGNLSGGKEVFMAGRLPREGPENRDPRQAPGHPLDVAWRRAACVVAGGDGAGAVVGDGVRDACPRHGGVGVERGSCGRRCGPPGWPPPWPARAAVTAEGALLHGGGCSWALPKRARLQGGLLCKSTLTS